MFSGLPHSLEAEGQEEKQVQSPVQMGVVWLEAELSKTSCSTDACVQ